MSIIFILLLGCADTTEIEDKLSAIEKKISVKTSSDSSSTPIVVDYKIVKTSSTSKLEEQVKDLMENGWQPIGGHDIEIRASQSSRKYDNYHYYQTMVKYE